MKMSKFSSVYIHEYVIVEVYKIASFQKGKYRMTKLTLYNPFGVYSKFILEMCWSTNYPLISM